MATKVVADVNVVGNVCLPAELLGVVDDKIRGRLMQVGYQQAAGTQARLPTPPKLSVDQPVLGGERRRVCIPQSTTPP